MKNEIIIGFYIFIVVALSVMIFNATVGAVVLIILSSIIWSKIIAKTIYSIDELNYIRIAIIFILIGVIPISILNLVIALIFKINYLQLEVLSIFIIILSTIIMLDIYDNKK